jgi:hypothetical protein
MRRPLGLTLIVLAGTVVALTMDARAVHQGAPTQGGAQAAPARPGTGLIVGHAVDAGTGKPVSGVIVMLSGGGPPAGAAQRVMVDANGGFVFGELRPGSYSLVGQRPGYTDAVYGRRLPNGSGLVLELGDGERVTDLELRLWKFASIAGTVLDEAGEPVVGINVRTLRRSFVAGRRRFAATAAGTTDDRGMYRIASLVPGDYVVAVPTTETTLSGAVVEEYHSGGGSPELRSAIVGVTATIDVPVPGNPDTQRVGDFILQTSSRSPVTPEPADAGRLAVYPTVFYPDAAGSAEAALIPLGSGEERAGVDLHLRAVVTSRVSGTLVGPDGPVPLMSLKLVPKSADDLMGDAGFETAMTLTDRKGAFTFLGVPAGQYVIRAMKVPPASGMGRGGLPGPLPIPDVATLWAAEPVSVGRDDVTLTVTLTRGIRVSGRFEFEGAKPRPTDLQMQQVPIVIEPVDARSTGSIPPGHADADGTFKTYGLPAGRYLIRIGGSPPGWTFKAAMYDGKDRSEAMIELKSGDLSDVVVIFTDTPTELSGTVQARGASEPDAVVLLFPSDPAAWVDFGVNARRERSTRPSRSGAYVFLNPPAGDYFVVAIPVEASGDWQDPKRLEALGRVATHVRVDDGHQVKQDLQTAVVR